VAQLINKKRYVFESRQEEERQINIINRRKDKQEDGFSFEVDGNVFITKPIIGEPKFSDELKVPCFGILKNKVKSFLLSEMPKAKIEGLIEKTSILIKDLIEKPKVELGLKTDKKKDKSSSPTEEKEKKKGVFLFEAGYNFNIKMPTIDTLNYPGN
jgi:hypothetical protein